MEKDSFTPSIRMVEAYDISTDELVYEERVGDISIKDLKKIFGQQEDDPLYFNVYEINESNVDFFKNKVHRKIELNKYAYYLACYRSY